MRPSIAERRLLAFCETCGVQPSLRQLATKSAVSKFLSPPTVPPRQTLSLIMPSAVARSAVPLASVNRAPDPRAFNSGRHFAAWIGLTPKMHSTGGKERLGRISKMGNPVLRSLLVVGATAVSRHARRGATVSPWLTGLLARRPAKVAAIALANKMARVIWALLTKGGVFTRRPATAAQHAA